jgi:predicted PurR-regulated permease PerM
MRSKPAASSVRTSYDPEPLVFILLAAALVGCGFLLWPFLVALTGLGLIALITQSPLNALRRKVHSKTASAGIAVLCVTICIIVPAWLAIHFLGQRILSAVSLLRNPGTIQRLHDGFETVRSFAVRHSIPIGEIDLQSTIDNASGPIGSAIVSAVGGSVATITDLVLMLFLLFFWYRSGDTLVFRARQLMPFSAPERRFLGATVVRTVRAVIMGRFVVAAVQAILAWITFLALSVPGASLLGTVMFVCCVLPAVGAFFVWVPVAIYLVLIHAWTKAIILSLIGTFVLSTIDNVLQAIVTGAQARMGTVEMFLSILGGVWLLGISGLVLGPLIWVVTGGLFLIWNKRQAARASVPAS